MRALAVFPEARELRIINLPTPQATREHDVTVRIREVGICGTDREICQFHYGEPPSGERRLVLGHEALGEVVGIGSAVCSLKVGDLVAFTVRRPCDNPACMACRAGRQDFCVSGAFHERGIKEADGFMTELVVEEEKYLVHVPPALADVGVLVEPLSVAAKASMELDIILRRYPWEVTGLRALVLGAGPIGLLAAMMLVARNAEAVVYSLEAATSDRAGLARACGAQYVSGRDVRLADMASRVGTFDVVFEAVGMAPVAFGALSALAANGVFILSGIPAGSRSVEIDLNGIMRDIVLKNQVVFGTVNASRSAFETSVQLLEQFMTLFPDAVRGLITDKARIDDAPALLRNSGGVKQVIAMPA